MRSVKSLLCAAVVLATNCSYSLAETSIYGSFLDYLAWPKEVDQQMQSRILSDLRDFCAELKVAVVPLSIQELEWLDQVTVLIDGRRGLSVNQSSGSTFQLITQSSAYRRDAIFRAVNLCIESTGQLVVESDHDRSSPSLLAVGVYNLINISMAKDDITSGYKEGWMVASSGMHNDTRFDWLLEFAPDAALKLTGYIARQY